MPDGMKHCGVCGKRTAPHPDTGRCGRCDSRYPVLTADVLDSKDKFPEIADNIATRAEMLKGVFEGKAHTALTEKAFSPLIIRKTTRFGFPIFVALITDDNLDELDEHVLGFVNMHIDLWKSNSIQDKRNLAGLLSDRLTEVYNRVEGVAVIFSIDKMMVSSLFGDFMNHTPCRLELYTLLNMMTNI